MAPDGGFVAASLVDVAVRAAVLAGAPRRTVAATAAAVATAVMVALRLGAGAGGGAAAALPSASQARRAKRKKKAGREAAAAAARQPQEEEAAEARVHDGARVTSAEVGSLAGGLSAATAADLLTPSAGDEAAEAATPHGDGCTAGRLSAAEAADPMTSSAGNEEAAMGASASRASSRTTSRARSAGSMSTNELRRNLGLSPRAGPSSWGRTPYGRGSDCDEDVSGAASDVAIAPPDGAPPDGAPPDGARARRIRGPRDHRSTTIAMARSQRRR